MIRTTRLLMAMAVVMATVSTRIAADPSSDVLKEIPLDNDFSQVVDMLPGVVKPADHVVLSAPFDGVVMRIDVDEGDEISVGEPIATMDDRVAQASVKVAEQVAASEIEIRIAESKLVAAQKFARRVGKAHRHSAASDLELDRSKASVDQANRMLEKAHEQRASALARLKLEQARLAQHTVSAPFDGRIIQVAANEGESLNRSQEIVSLANIKKLHVEMQVPLTWFRQLSKGQMVWLAASAPVDCSVPARIVTIEPNVDAGTETFRCRMEIDNKDELLPAGFTVKLVTPVRPIAQGQRRISLVEFDARLDSPFLARQ